VEFRRGGDGKELEPPKSNEIRRTRYEIHERIRSSVGMDQLMDWRRRTGERKEARKKQSGHSLTSVLSVVFFELVILIYLCMGHGGGGGTDHFDLLSKTLNGRAESPQI